MIVTNPNLYVVTGGPGTGKTTTLEELAKIGYAYAPETARQIIREQTLSGGTALPWADRDSYTRLMLARSIESFAAHTPAPRPIFSDRGIPDTLCYARLIGVPDTSDIEDACRLYRYATVVFLAPPWQEIYHTDAERKQDFAEAVATYDLMIGVYRELEYDVRELPKLPADLRARFILKNIR